MSEKAELSRYVTKKQLRALLGDGVSGAAGNTMVTNNYNLANVTQLGNTSITNASVNTVLVGGGGGGEGGSWATPGLSLTQNIPANSLNTVYQNTSGGLRLVVVSVECSISDAGATMSGWSYAEGLTGIADPPTTSVAAAGINTIDFQLVGGDPVRGNINIIDNLIFLVLNNYYYKVATAISGDGNTPSLWSWVEYDLGISLTL